MESTTDVRGQIEAILGEHVSRLLASGHLLKSEIDDLTAALRESKLLPDQIEADLAEELKSLCNLRYEIANAESRRLDGFGWSVNHMQQHMERFMKSKLEQMGTVLRTKKKIDVPKTLGFREAQARHLELGL